MSPRTKLETPLHQPLRVLVTGGGSGIGKAQVEAFLKEGYYVVSIDKQWPEIPQHKRLLCLTGDLTKPEIVERLCHEAITYLGGLDVLCNTAGQLDDYKSLDETSYAEFQYFLSVNLDSCFLVTQAVLPALLENGSSRVINMASIASLTAGGGGISYTAAKHAVAGFTKQLAYDYSKQGLRANAIAPGAVQTPMTQADFDENNGKMARWVANTTPVKRWSQPEEVARLTLYLASDDSDYMQGNIIPLDGGWLIR